MAETAADLVDNIPSTSSGQALPQVPVRQWVLSFPIPLRSLFAIHRDLITPVLRIIHRAINSHLIKQAGIERQQAPPAPPVQKRQVSQWKSVVVRLLKAGEPTWLHRRVRVLQ